MNGPVENNFWDHTEFTVRALQSFFISERMRPLSVRGHTVSVRAFTKTGINPSLAEIQWGWRLMPSAAVFVLNERLEGE